MSGYDDQGNQRWLVLVAETHVTVVIDEALEVVITVWVE